MNSPIFSQDTFELKIEVIETERDYKAALKAIEALWDARPGTPKGEALDWLATLVESYEEKSGL